MRTEGLYRFLFDGLPVRGAAVRLTECWQEALARRRQSGAFPLPVSALLGEMAAAGALLQSQIKFDGAVIVQLHGDGPVRLAVAEVSSDLAFRATATVTESVPGDAALPDMVNVQGNGRCAITLDASDRAEGVLPYQGVVPLYGDQREPLQRLSEVIEHYMLQSEQLDTCLMLAANQDVAAGLLVQRMPAGGLAGRSSAENEALIGRDEDFNRIAHLTATLTARELLDLDVDDLLRRLYFEEQVRRFDPEPVSFHCSCDTGRVERMLTGLGRAELEDILKEQGEIEVGCDFCGQQYHFNDKDVARLCAGESAASPVNSPGPNDTIH